MFERVGWVAEVGTSGLSDLRSAVEALGSQSLPDLPDARAEEDFCELQGLWERLEAERLRRLADLERRRVYARDGHLSLASWLVSRQGSAWGAARVQVRTARALEQMPLTQAALEEGAISLSALRVLIGAREVDPSAFRDSEAALVQAARIHSIAELQKVAAYWRARVEASEGDERRYERRGLHASVSFLGMVRLDGDLDPETGETFLSALGAVLDAQAHARTEEDTRTPAQRRADALGEICRQWLGRSDRPEVAGERPHLSLRVGVQALGRAARAENPDADADVGIADGNPAEFDHTGPTDARTALRLACDASVMRVVLSAESQPLDVGRRTPVVPSGMRRALIVRDRHCRFPGCDRPPSFCDAHHVVHWARGGETKLENLILLCRRHHRAVHHRGGFTLELVKRRPVFRRSDGSVLEAQDRGPP